MWRSWVSLKFAITYHVPVSTSVNISMPARAKAPVEMFMLTTRPAKGARKRRELTSPARVFAAALIASGLRDRRPTGEVLGTRRGERGDGGIPAGLGFVEPGDGGLHLRALLFHGQGRGDPLGARFLDSILRHELPGEEGLETPQMVVGLLVIRLSPLERRLRGPPPGLEAGGPPTREPA